MPQGSMSVNHLYAMVVIQWSASFNVMHQHLLSKIVSI